MNVCSAMSHLGLRHVLTFLKHLVGYTARTIVGGETMKIRMITERKMRGMYLWLCGMTFGSVLVTLVTTALCVGHSRHPLTLHIEDTCYYERFIHYDD